MGLRETLSFSSVNPRATSKCKLKPQILAVQFPLRIAERSRGQDLVIPVSEARRSSNCLPVACRPGSLVALFYLLCFIYPQEYPLPAAALRSADPAERRAWVPKTPSLAPRDCFWLSRISPCRPPQLSDHIHIPK